MRMRAPRMGINFSGFLDSSSGFVASCFSPDLNYEYIVIMMMRMMMMIMIMIIIMMIMMISTMIMMMMGLYGGFPQDLNIGDHENEDEKIYFYVKASFANLFLMDAHKPDLPFPIYFLFTQINL